MSFHDGAVDQIQTVARLRAKAMYWQAIVASAIQARTMSQRLQNTGTQRNAALARSSSATRHVVNIRFSNRPVVVKRFQVIHRCGVDVARRLVLLFGIGAKALP